MNIHKIVTKRNTSFILGFHKDSTENSPIITTIEVVNTDDPGVYTCKVTFSDKTFVSISDIVEVWRNP